MSRSEQHTGPYIVRHVKRYGYVDAIELSRPQAYATLEEAREKARGAAREAYGALKAVDTLPAEGGSVSLPDGSTITVEPVARRPLQCAWCGDEIDGGELCARCEQGGEAF